MCKVKKIISLLLAVVMLMGVMSAIEMSSIAGARELTIFASASNSLTKKQAKKLKKKIKNSKIKISAYIDRLGGYKQIVKWNKIKNATGYQFRLSKDQGNKNVILKKTVSTNNISYDILNKKLKLKNRTYYYCNVRAFAKYKIKGKTKKVYSKWYQSEVYYLVKELEN